MFSAIPALQYIILNRTKKSKPANFTVITILNIQVNAKATVVADEEQIKSKRLSRVESFRLFSYIMLKGILFFNSLDCEMSKTRETHFKLKSVT